MKYKYRPKNKKELIKAIKKEIFEVQGTPDNPNWNADLNCIDTSSITDMSDLFSYKYGLNKFNGNISKWNTKNVKNMYNMFYISEFNQNISNWNVSNVENMKSMFNKSKFNGDISNWNVSNVQDMSYMFEESQFNQDISKWNVSNVETMKDMFKNSKFNQDIGSWPLKEDTDLRNISISTEYNKLPDKIIFIETFQNILKNKKILYKSETVAKLFVYSLENNDKNFNFKTFFKDYLNNRKELYKNKGYKSEIIKKLILNDIADILKYLKDKDMQEKFMKITTNKNKEPNIDIVS